MNEAPRSHTLRDYLRVLRQRRLLIVACILVAAAGALVYSLAKTPVYEATSSISFNDQSAELQAIGVPTAQDFVPAQRASRGSRVVTRDDVVENVQEALQTPISADQLKDDVTAEVETESNLVTITATSDDAEFAARVANEFADQTLAMLTAEDRKKFRNAADDLQDRFNRLNDVEQIGSVGTSYQEQISRLLALSTLSQPVEINDPATVPEEATSPKPIRDTIIAAVLGLIVGIGAAFLRHSLDRRITEPHDAQHELGLPLVGYVHDDTLGQSGTGKNGDAETRDEEMEAFRILRTNFGFLAKDRELRSVAVTSALPEEGKSTVATWFARASALAGRRTLLLECDLRRPVFAERLGIKSAPGLSEYANGKATKAKITRTVKVEGPGNVKLEVITAGESVESPAEMLASPKVKRLLAALKKEYDLVVIDTAPVLPVGDTLELLPEVDAALFCVRLGQTTRDQVENAKAVLEHLPDQPTGLVATGLERGSDDDYYGYYSSSKVKTKSAA